MTRFLFSIVVLLGAVALPRLAVAQGESPTVDGMDPRTYDLWNRHWRRFAVKMIPFADDYVAMPLWDPRFPSSRQMTPEMYRKAKSVKIRESYGSSMVRDIQVVPPVEEGRIAAMTIPQMSPGQYGYIHSFEVTEVLGPQEMLIENIWLIDAAALSKDRDKYEAALKQKADSSEAAETTDKMFEARDAAEEAQRDRGFRTEMRLVGFPTEGINPKDRWPHKGEELSIAIVVLGEENMSGGRMTRRPRLVVGPAQWLHQTLTEDQFIDMLNKRGLTPTQFIELVTTSFRREDTPADADARVFADLDRRRKAAIEAAAELASQEKKR